MSGELTKWAIEAPAEPDPRDSRQRFRRTRPCLFLRRTLITAAAVSLSAAATVMPPASPAQAWTWSPRVDLVGYATCKTVPHALDTAATSTWVYVYKTGEIAQQSASLFGVWEAHLKTIPPEGSWAAVWIYCAVPGTEPGWRFARDVYVGRPLVGVTRVSTPLGLRA